MEQFNELRSRVEDTAEKLANLHVERREQGKSLIDTLAGLEDKYSIQEDQLAHYRERMEPLERANQDLAVLLENLLDLIDRGFGEDSLQPMRNATSMASRMLAEDLCGGMPPEEAGAEEVIAFDAADGPGTDDAAEAGTEPGPVSFEDVSGEELTAELVEDPVTDDLPDIVKASCRPAPVEDEGAPAVAMDDAVEQSAPVIADNADDVEEIGFDELVADAGEPAEIGFAPDEADMTADDAKAPATDIRALLERVQALAGKAEAMQDDGSADAELQEIAQAVEIAQRAAQKVA